MIHHHVALLVVEHRVFCLCRQLSSAEPHLSWHVSVEAAVGEVLTEADRAWEEENVPCHQLSASIFPNCSLWFYFWGGRWDPLRQLCYTTWQLGQDLKWEFFNRTEGWFLVTSSVWLVAKHPQTGNIPQWFRQKPCKSQLSSLLITQGVFVCFANSYILWGEEIIYQERPVVGSCLHSCVLQLGGFSELILVCSNVANSWGSLKPSYMHKVGFQAGNQENCLEIPFSLSMCQFCCENQYIKCWLMPRVICQANASQSWHPICKIGVGFLISFGFVGLFLK